MSDLKKRGNETLLVESRAEVLSPWVTLQHRSIQSPDGEIEVYHSLAQSDYTSIVALTKDRKAVLVRQFRPAVDCFTVETPGGLKENNEKPEVGILRELHEESGFTTDTNPVLLGRTRPDLGRLENWVYGFFVADVELTENYEAESGIERFTASAEEVSAMILDGRINSTLHIWLLTQSALQGYWPELLERLINQKAEIES